MRRRPTRPNIFRELRRFGVFSGDWKFILIPTAFAYFLPFAAGIWIYHVPAGFPIGLAVFIALIAAFNFLRASKPECWLQNRIDAATDGWSTFRAPLDDDFASEEWVES